MRGHPSYLCFHLQSQVVVNGQDLLNLGDGLDVGDGLDGGDVLDLVLVQHLGLDVEGVAAPAHVLPQQVHDVLVLFATAEHISYIPGLTLSPTAVKRR